MPPTQNQNIPPTPDDSSLLNNPWRKHILVVSAILAGFVILVGGVFAFLNKELLMPALEPQESFSVSNLVPGSEEDACYVPGDGKVFYLRDIPVLGADRKTFVDLVKDLKKRDCYGKDAERVYSGESVIAGADPKTFTILSYVEDLDSGLGGGVSYAKDTDHVFIEGKMLPSADPDTFQILEGFFTKDNNNVYYYDKIIASADPKTFTTVSSSYGKDSQHVYYAQVSGFGGYEYSLVSHADPSTFEALEGAFGKDAQHVFAYSCFGEGGPSCAAVLDGADPKTFVALNSEYGKDKNHVYYPRYSSPGQIIDADPASFTALNELVAKDRSHVFLRDQILDGTDPDTVSIVNGRYIRDGSHVYFLNLDAPFPGADLYSKFQMLRDADPATFGKVGDSYYTKDSKNVYLEGKVVQNADPKTFSVISGTFFTDNTDTVKDSKAIYRGGSTLPMPPGADITSLTALNHYYFADKNRVYFCDIDCAILVPNADVRTFTTVDAHYARDKYSVFYKMKKIPEADPATFSRRIYYGPSKDPQGYYDAKDKNRFYLEGRVVVLPNQ